jgi:hypothetical protein
MNREEIAEKIMESLSARRGIDLYQYDEDITKEIRNDIVEILSTNSGEREKGCDTCCHKGESRNEPPCIMCSNSHYNLWDSKDI